MSNILKFTPDMVQAIIEGRKTQTRRLIKNSNSLSAHDVEDYDLKTGVVFDGQPTGGTYYLDDTNAVRKAVISDPEYWAVRPEYRKITHSTQPLEAPVAINGYGSYEYISLQEVEELLGEVDVEKKAHNWSTRQTTRSTDYWRSMVSTYVEAYNQALEDNKEKKYTEEDMLRLLYWADSDARNIQGQKFEQFIQSLQPTEWEVEFDGDKLKLKNKK